MKANDQRIPQHIFDEIIRNLETMESDYVEPPQHIFVNIIRNLEIRRGKIRVLKAVLVLDCFYSCS